MEEIDLAYQNWLENGTTITAYGLFEFLKKRYELVKKELNTQYEHKSESTEINDVIDYYTKTNSQISRGCCKECGEGFDNEEEWKYNTECELCGEPIPEHLIIKKDESNGIRSKND